MEADNDILDRIRVIEEMISKKSLKQEDWSG